MAFKKGDKFILELGKERKMFHEFEIAGTDLYVKTDLLEKLTQYTPTAQPMRKKGLWIVTAEFEDCRYAKCNQCKVTQVFYYNKPLTNYCPNCGTDMRGN